jgi:transposase
MNAKSYEILRKKSRGRFTMAKFVQLKYLAKNTVGRSDDFLLQQMDMLLDIQAQLDAKISEVEGLIQECIMGIDPPILTIPGIGYLSAAVILSEYGDFSKYENPSKMLSFAGLEPGYFQSGQSEHTGHMVKHGSSYLRYALMNACLPLITHDPVFAEYYAKKRAEGKPYRVALTHVAKKLLRVIYTLQTKNIPYDPAQIR